MIARCFMCSLLAVAVAAAKAAPAQAAPATAVQIAAGPLADTLSELGRQTGAEILYDKRILAGVSSPGIRGTMSPDQALAYILAGTGVGYRKTADGVFVLFANPRAAPQVRQAAVPEILIIARRTQNVDIRRTENDVQPYVVVTGAEIQNAHPDNIGTFFRDRLTIDSSPISNAQDTVSGDAGLVNSVINLRGLGSVRTLVLVDGRRMPSFPTAQFDFGQGDLNAIPINAIERIETLTGTAGGIYGPGAIGGVVNVVLRRDYRGADIHFTGGLSSRGDAGDLGIEARVGFTPDHGRTDVMIFASRAGGEPLLAAKRDYGERAWRRRYQNNPSGYLERPVLTDSIGVFSQAGNLTFDPEFGGASLDSPVTYLPLRFTGTAADRMAMLTANAGSVVFRPPPELPGTDNYLLSNPTATSAMLTVRYRFSSRLHGYVDVLHLRDDGRFQGRLQTTVVTDADAPNNPFQQPVRFTFPDIGYFNRVRTTLASTRLTFGLIADLGSWKGSADGTLGWVKTTYREDQTYSGSAFFEGLIAGTLGPDGRPIVDPLGQPSRLAAVSRLLAEQAALTSSQVNRLRSVSTRLAGPLVSLPGGPLDLTLLAEQRREHTPERPFDYSAPSFQFQLPSPVRAQTITSAYGELRAPVVRQDLSGILRGLEFQLAARYDRVRTTLPKIAGPSLPTNDQLVSVGHGAVTFTAGGRVFPTRGLMLRASVATGQLPPTIEQLSVYQETLGNDQLGPPDPRRGNRPVGSEGPVVFNLSGSLALQPEHARTISIGAVLDPNESRWPRISVDFSRIDVRREVSFFPADLSQVLANEDQFSRRITRAPLTDADRALGFTAGRILAVDLGAYNGGRTRVGTLDAHFDWALNLKEWGRLRLYGSATWYSRFTIKQSPDAPSRNFLNFAQGPVRLRANVGAEWTRGPLLIGLNAHYFGHYAPTYFDDFFGENSLIIANQGSNRIPSQTYIDLTLRRHFTVRGGGRLRSFDVNLGVLNLFDRSPPIITQNLLPGYSYYGDPRRRRFELVLSSSF